MQIPANTNVFAQFSFGGHCLPERKNKEEGKKNLPFSRAISSSVSKSSFVEATVLLVTNLMYRLKERLFSLPSTRPSIRFFSLFSPFHCKKI